MKNSASLLVITFVFGLAVTGNAQVNSFSSNPLFGRKYRAGETYRYRLTTMEYHGENLAFTSVAVCELRVVKDSNGIFFDEVHWTTKKTTAGKDTVDETEKALSVKPYRISLAAGGRIDIPPIAVPEMTGQIQDFNTFFVAVSPLLAGMDQLKRTGDSLIMKEPVTADFSNGAFILKGQDCIRIRLKLMRSTKKTVELYTGFMPPVKPCLSYITADMNTPVVADTLNNFQMVSPSGKDLYNLQYGREYFFINSSIRRSDGKIINAEMFNRLNLKVKINCDKDYKNCAFETLFAEHRILRLELLP